MAVAGLLLCGGAARRFGSAKLLAGSQPIVVDAARRLIEGAGSALAIIPLDLDDRKLRTALEGAGCTVLATDRAVRGMGASLAAGVAATTMASGWIVALGDMPRVDPRTIAAVREAIESGATIAAPFDGDGRRGHPVGFSAALSDELLALDGDVGARAILERHADQMQRIVTVDAGIFIDIDTPQDLERLR